MSKIEPHDPNCATCTGKVAEPKPVVEKTTRWTDEEREEMAQRRYEENVAAGAYELGSDGKPIRVTSEATDALTAARSALVEARNAGDACPVCREEAICKKTCLIRRAMEDIDASMRARRVSAEATPFCGTCGEPNHKCACPTCNHCGVSPAAFCQHCVEELTRHAETYAKLNELSEKVLAIALRRERATTETSDAYGLPNDLRAAKEEIHEWRQAIEALGVMGGPGALRRQAVAMHAHHDEHHEREKLLRAVVADARKYGQCNGSCVTCANMGESCGSRLLNKALVDLDRYDASHSSGDPTGEKA